MFTAFLEPWMKWMSALIAASPGLFVSPARADWTDPSAAYLCDSGAKRFSMKSVMETSAPDPGAVAAEPGYSPVQSTADFRCEFGAVTIRAHFIVDPPRASGTCGGFTHTYIRWLRVNGIELFRSATFNSACFSDPELYKLEIEQNGGKVHIRSCYATWVWGAGYHQTDCKDRDLSTNDAPDAITLCDDDETVVFSCVTTRSTAIATDRPRTTSRRIISLCGTPGLSAAAGRLTYRFGSGRQHVELEYPTDERVPGEAFTSYFYCVFQAKRSRCFTARWSRISASASRCQSPGRSLKLPHLPAAHMTHPTRTSTTA